MSKKARTMGQISLNDGSFKLLESNVETTLPQYIRTINRLNESAFVYGVVYVPRDGEYDAYMKEQTDA